ARRAQTSATDGISKVGFVERSAASVATDDRDDPRMPRDGRAANRSLVASRRHDNDAAICGMIERLSQCAFAFSRWHLGESRAQIHKTSASINTFDNSSGELLRRRAWNQLFCHWRLRKNWTPEQGAARSDSRRCGASLRGSN